MRILIIKISPIEELSSSMYRTLAIARGLLEQGHDIDMVVRTMSHYNVQGKELDFIKKINIVRLSKSRLQEQIREGGNKDSQNKKAKSALLKIARKMWHMFRVFDGSISEAKKIDIHSLPADTYDIVISSSDPKTSHIAMQRLIDQGLKYGKWIQYWGDPMTADIASENIYPKFIIKQKEKKLLKNADKLIYVSPFTLKQQQRLFPKFSDRMTFLPIPYMEKKIYPVTGNEKFTVDYYGNYEGKVRNLRPFYEACVSLGDEICAHIVGDGDLGLQSTEHVTVLPRGIVDELQEKTDVIVCLLNNRGTQIPGKIYHAAGTNKKILVIMDGNRPEKMRKYLESFDRFFICDNTVDSIKKAILELREEKGEYLPSEKLAYHKLSLKFIE